jgi:XPB/Ssl2-like helicase family protein
MPTRSAEVKADSASARRRLAPRGTERDLTLVEFLDRRKVSELQEMWGFWQNGAKAPVRKPELVAPILASLADEGIVRSRIHVLSERPRQVLLALVRAEGYSARLFDLVGPGTLESYEVEAAARALARRGFVQVTRVHISSKGSTERYTLPVELGDLIAAVLREERRGPREVFSLAGHVASLSPSGRATLASQIEPAPAPDAPPEALAAALLASRGEDPLSCLEDAVLADALRRAALEHGGIMLRAAFEAQFPSGVRIQPKELRTKLEGLGLGTVTNLSLVDFGIELGGESVVLFEEVAEKILDRARADAHAEHDRVDSARVDLLTDLQQFLRLVANTPLRVTQGRSIYRAAQHRILDAFTFVEDVLMDRERMFGLVYDLAFGLELVGVSEDQRLALTRRGESWETEELTDKVRAVYARFLEERLPDGRDFHVRRLRRAVAAALLAAPPGRFLPPTDVPFRVRNDYLAMLEEQGVREQYKNRFQYTYSPPRESPSDVRRGLCEYVLTRLYPLGVVDVALSSDDVVGVRLTELGRRLFLGEKLAQPAPPAETPAPARPTRPLVVNPDFEVLLYPEGDVNEIAHRLSRFASRTKSDEVAHYRIAKDAVERAVVKGMDAAEILDFLETHARASVPQNVAYSIEEWARRIAFAHQRDVVLLTTDDAGALDRVLATPEVRRLLAERLSPTAAALRTKITDWKVLETLRALGVYFK